MTPSQSSSSELVCCLCEEEEAVVVYSGETGAATPQVFRDCNAAARGGGFLCLHDRYFVAPHRAKPALIVHEWGRETPAHTCYVAERVACLSADASGTYVVGGSPSGAVYLWLVETGEFLCSWKAHYRAVTHVTFLEGELVLLSAGEDALIHAWNLVDVLCQSSGGDAKPVATWSEHSLPVTSLSCGKTGGPGALFLSSSLDHSCRVWQLGAKLSLLTVSCPSPVLCCCLDALEQYAYAGGKDGNIFEKCLTEVSRSGGGGAASSSQVSGGLGESVTKTFKGHTKAVTSVRCAGNGKTLISSSEDGLVYFWNRASGERVRSISRETPITFASVLVLNDQGGGPLSSLSERRAQRAARPSLQPFKKYKSVSGEEEQLVAVTALPDRSVEGMLESIGGSQPASGASESAVPREASRGSEEEASRLNHKLREELEMAREELQKKEDRLHAVEGQLLDLLQAKNTLM
ncbi:WD40 repeat domain-containing protein [Chloropicon primus]|uniref:WD40 repeat domain-containing protein n=1 Tax=Chloropicon primus TaxID=1764295 RepID=A0A5B8MHT0_9CHLO|nr:WD40 repeat domain-containing protein [Chloropicon primus]UPQ99220.1 WD40 repeat domain-containing protein [Chloropicon primus]|eukprot:QDZ20009.1 WD40 repeat domain-containing protein [Chloropicon primus]